MLLKGLLSLRLLQTPLSLIFLIFISWVQYLLSHSDSTNSQPSHPITAVLRFLTPILTLPYVSYEIFRTLKARRSADPENNVFCIRNKSRSFKIGRVMAEFTLGALWFFSFVLALGIGGWSLMGDNTQYLNASGTSTTTSSAAAATGGSVFGSPANGTVTTTTTGNSAAVIPNASQSGTTTFVVPPGGKLPMMLASFIWMGMIGLFALSALAVIVDTARNWRSKTGEKDGAQAGKV